MKILFILFLFMTNFFAIAASPQQCTISHRNGGFVVENQRSRVIIDKFFNNSQKVVHRLGRLIKSKKCSLPKPLNCKIRKLNGGYAIKSHNNDRLLSNLSYKKENTQKVLLFLIEAGICNPTIELELVKNRSGHLIPKRIEMDDSDRNIIKEFQKDISSSKDKDKTSPTTTPQ